MSAGAPPQPGPHAPDAGQPNDPAAYWTKLLQDPAFRAMPPEQRTQLLQKQVQAAQSQQHTADSGQNMALGQAVGAVPQSKSSPSSETGRSLGRESGSGQTSGMGESHPLDAVIDDPNADHGAALMQYVYGP